jgi:hypothetical protein
MCHRFDLSDSGAAGRRSRLSVESRLYRDGLQLHASALVVRRSVYEAFVPLQLECLSSYSALIPDSFTSAAYFFTSS